MVRSKLVLFTAAWFILTVALSGCTASLSMPGAQGKLTAEVKGSVFRVYRATLRAMDQMKLEPLEKRCDASVGVVKSRFADNKGITIEIHYEEDNLTKLSIMVGDFGDQQRSQQILDKIYQNL